MGGGNKNDRDGLGTIIVQIFLMSPQPTTRYNDLDGLGTIIVQIFLMSPQPTTRYLARGFSCVVSGFGQVFNLSI